MLMDKVSAVVLHKPCMDGKHHWRLRRPGAEVAIAQSLPLPVRKFRCLVRLTAYQPLDSAQMCHRSEDVRQAGSSGA